MTVQFADANAAARTWAVSGPSGMTIDPNTGLLSWTPGLTNVGNVTATVTGTNSSGTQYVTLDFPVYFTAPTTNISATVSGNNANVTWTAPTSNASQITGYLIDLTWIVNGITHLAVFNSVGTGTSYTLPIPLLGSIHYHLTVTAYDALGDLGAPNSQSFSFTGP
jgi:Putative Ig domain/Fibronectin type III domain